MPLNLAPLISATMMAWFLTHRETARLSVACYVWAELGDSSWTPTNAVKLKKNGGKSRVEKRSSMLKRNDQNRNYH